MKRSLFVIITLICIISLAIQPFFTGHMPWRGDGLLHFYRLAALENAITAGDLYPRWIPDLGYGYGFPLFNYYAPFSYYIVLPLRWLGFSLQTAISASYVLALFIMALGAYLLGRDLWGETAGFTAAVALIYSPYILYNLHHRAALAELWGLAWLTLILWAIQKPSVRAPLVGAPYTFLLLSHNITALIGTPIILAFLLWPKPSSNSHASTLPPTIHYSPFTLLSLFSALLLTAFFWLPALLETGYVQIEQLYASANFAYANNFLTLTDLFAFPTTADPQLITPSIPLMLGWGQLLIVTSYWLLVIGYQFFNVRQHVTRNTQYATPSPFTIHHSQLFFLLLTLLAAFMTLSISQPLWNTLPLLEFVQFPWRFLGPAAIGLALWCGYAANKIANSQLSMVNGQLPTSHFLLFTSYFLLVLSALPLLFPSLPPPLPTSATRTDLINFEIETGWLGTTAAADYLPRTVQQLPPPFYELPALTKTGSTATFNQFAYPGWQAFADGRPVSITPTDPNGLIHVQAPPNTQTLSIHFGNTPLRAAANVISIVTAVLLLITFIISQVKSKKLEVKSSSYSPFTIHPAPFTILAVFLILFVLKTTYLDHADTIFRRVQQPPNILNANFDNQLRLLDATIPQTTLAADEPLTAELYWQLVGQPQQELSIGLHLLSANGLRYGQSDHMHPSGFPITRWRPEEYARDTHQLEIDPATPPGEYTLELFVYTIPDGRRLNLLSDAGTPVGNTFALGRISITPPSPPLLASQITAANTFDPPLTLSPDLQLIGYNAPVTTAELGQTIPLTLFWRTLNPPTETPKLILISDTRRTEPYQFSPSSTAPNTNWTAGQIGRDEQLLTLPPLAADSTPLTTGNYFLAILHNNQYQPLTSLHLTAPPHTFTPPSPSYEPASWVPLTPPTTLSINDTPFTTLIGYDLPATIPNSPTLTLTLYYQPLTTTVTSYTAFVQLLASDGRVIAQSDHIPTHNGLTRPTTGWVPAEYIADSHTLELPADLPSDTYQLITGLYNPATNQRLRTETNDYITLTQLAINNE